MSLGTFIIPFGDNEKPLATAEGANHVHSIYRSHDRGLNI